MVGDAAGLLLVIDRLGRTIAELEQQNEALREQNEALTHPVPARAEESTA